MYATEKELKFQIRHVNENINNVASDLGDDIKTLHQMITSLQADQKLLNEQIIFLTESQP